jgi:hypothetical protein
VTRISSNSGCVTIRSFAAGASHRAVERWAEPARFELAAEADSDHFFLRARRDDAHAT